MLVARQFSLLKVMKNWQVPTRPAYPLRVVVSLASRLVDLTVRVAVRG